MNDLIDIFVSCGRGMEPLLATEIKALTGAEVRERHGGASTSCLWDHAYRLCLWSRVASRVLMPVQTGTVGDADQLYELAKSIDWTSWFDVERTFAIEVAGQSRALTHSHFAALRVKDAVVDRFRDRFGRRPDVSADDADVRIHLHLNDTAVTLSIDLSGESLHRRGYRMANSAAPLKENLAAALLLRAGWPQIARDGGALMDPLCGSGTLVIEAALMAADMAPGLARARFGFMGLNTHDEAAWRDLVGEARARGAAGRQQLPRMLGSDRDAATVASSAQAARRAGLEEHVMFSIADAVDARPVGEKPGLVIANPPYGERLGSEAELIKLYSLFGATLKSHFGGWRAAIFTGRPDLGPRMGLRADRLFAFYNGDLPCKLLTFDIPAVETRAPGQAEDFENRLRKNHKHLAKWAKRTGVSSYRVYDADLPDYAVAVDLYAAESLQVHVQEYAAPSTVDPVHAERRLRDALSVIQSEFRITSSDLHLKVRRAQKGNEQYSRQSEQAQLHEINEAGCRLLVNLDDYLDTGVFLDHRALRRRIQAEAAGKRFLNLFSYTGTVTVHAAVGNAKSTCSVDLSANYLEWARQNLERNGFSATVEAAKAAAQTAWRGPRTQLAGGRAFAHRLVRADCLVWLREQAALAGAAKFDLILCDPPTFSNSKRMDDTLDVQRDHVELIRHCMALLAPGGTLYFSNNRKRFKIDAEALSAYAIQDITAQTLDEDFRRPPPPHRCWAIRAPSVWATSRPETGS